MTRAPLADRVCLVTGANRGIGEATASGLASRGATVVMLCRDREQGERAAQRIRARSGNPAVDLMVGDLASQSSIRRFAEHFARRYPQLHVLVNNAGLITPKRTLTPDGLETQFAVNHLAYFRLSALLLDQLRAGTPSRIVNVSSEAHRLGRIDFDDLQGEHHYRPGRAYAQSKLANVLFTYELARRLEGSGITANCLHPGVIGTKLLRNYLRLPAVLGLALAAAFASPETGAATSIYLASSPAVETLSGRYFVKCQEARSSASSYDAATARRLWEVSTALTDRLAVAD